MQGRTPYAAHTDFLLETGWTRGTDSLWSNPDPLFQCKRCVDEGQRCVFAEIQQVAATRGGGIRLSRCLGCINRRTQSACPVTKKATAGRYHFEAGKWVRGERFDERRQPQPRARTRRGKAAEAGRGTDQEQSPAEEEVEASRRGLEQETHREEGVEVNFGIVS